MKHKITIKAKEKYRSFSEGYTVTLDYNDVGTIYLMGKNGCGKSTLIQAIRGQSNSNKDAKDKWNAKDVCIDVLSHFDVNIEGFNNVYHLDIDGLDNATSMWNSADASGFIQFGGWATRSLSAGEKSVVMFSNLRNEIKDEENTLIILDELDGHFDTEFTMKFPRLLNRLFPKSKKLIVTHDILMATINDGNIVEILSERENKNWVKCNVLRDKPRVLDSKTKELKFMLDTGYTISKLEDNSKKKKNTIRDRDINNLLW